MGLEISDFGYERVSIQNLRVLFVGFFMPSADRRYGVGVFLCHLIFLCLAQCYMIVLVIVL